MATVARLTADLTANTSRFESGMKRASSQMKDFQKVVSVAAKTSAVAIAGVGLALTALTVKQMGAIDAAAKLARSLGVGLREFQAISLAAEEAGVEQTTLTNAITKSQKAIFEAAQGVATYADAFNALGLSTQDLLKLTPDQQFNKIAEALSKVENATERTALATELFGRSGRDLLNLLDGYNEKVDSAREFNDRFNISLNEIDSNKVEEANDAMARVRMIANGLGNTIATYVSPLITEMANNLIEASFDGQDFTNALTKGMAIVGGAIDVVRMAILGIRTVILEVDKAIIKLVADASFQLFQLADKISNIPGLEETAQKLKDSFLTVNEAAQISAENWKVRKEALNKEVRGFETTLDKINRIQQQADVRSREAIKKSVLVPKGTFDADESAVDKLKDLEQFEKKAKDAQKEQLDYNELLADSFSDIGKALAEGGKMADKFKSIAVNALSQIAQSIVSKGLSGGLGSIFGGGSSGGGFFGSLLGSAAKGIGSFFGLPSFDVGSYNVPSDMVANIHKGEMIIPAKEAAELRAGGGSSGVQVIQNITIGQGVTAQVRAEVAKMLPDLRRTALQGVEDARLRGASI